MATTLSRPATKANSAVQTIREASGYYKTFVESSQRDSTRIRTLRWRSYKSRSGATGEGGAAVSRAEVGCRKRHSEALVWSSRRAHHALSSSCASGRARVRP